MLLNEKMCYNYADRGVYMSVFMGKMASKLSKSMGHRGTNIGGSIALKFDKNLFRKLSKNIDNIVLISGTNGKSTITNIIASVLELDSQSIISNKEGANLYTGILSSMVEKQNISGKRKFKYGVFEVDEGNLPLVLKDMDEALVVLSNFFRDQLDRYSEMDILIDKIKNGINKDKVELILNADDPFCMRFENFNYVSYGLDKQIDNFTPDKVTDSKYCYRCGKPLTYTKNYYAQLGHYECECGFKRPTPDYLLTNIYPSTITINKKIYHHHLLGLYNVYNILAAVAALKELGIDDELIKKGLENYHSSDGRMQKFTFNNKHTYLNLVKNPAGMNMSLKEIKNLDINKICFIVNDKEGDGIDVSWLWDSDFEILLDNPFKKYYASGTRAFDVALRLKNMGIPQSKIVVNPLFETIVDTIIDDNSLICCSYTALNDTKNILLKKEGQ